MRNIDWSINRTASRVDPINARYQIPAEVTDRSDVGLSAQLQPSLKERLTPPPTVQSPQSEALTGGTVSPHRPSNHLLMERPPQIFGEKH